MANTGDEFLNLILSMNQSAMGSDEDFEKEIKEIITKTMTSWLNENRTALAQDVARTLTPLLVAATEKTTITYLGNHLPSAVVNAIEKLTEEFGE